MFSPFPSVTSAEKNYVEVMPVTASVTYKNITGHFTSCCCGYAPYSATTRYSPCASISQSSYIHEIVSKTYNMLNVNFKHLERKPLAMCKEFDLSTHINPHI